MRLAVLRLLVCGLGLAPGPGAAQTPGASYDQIIERGWISFGVYEDFAPYSWSEGDAHRGTDVELGRLIAEALGVEARFRAIGADENVDDDLRNHVWKGPLIGGDVVNVMLHVPYDRELAIRNELVVLTGLYMTENIAIAYRKDAYTDGAPTPGYFRFHTVGVENDSLADFYLSSLAGGQLIPNIRRYTTPSEAMSALRSGEISAVMGARAQLEHGLAEGLAVHQPPLPGLAIGKWLVGVAVRHTYRQLGYAVDGAIQAAVEDGRLAAIFQNYGLTWQAPSW
jgi:ABC-type amino acid transport substrate-binding protein